MNGLVLALLAAALVPASGQPEDALENVAGQEVPLASEEALVRQMAQRLRADPSVAESLAARVGRSKIADGITAAQDPQARQREIRAWIASDPQAAANVALGLASDDSNGTHSFEDMVTRTVHKRLEFNPNSRKGLYGRLKKTTRDSKLLKQQAEEMTEEEKREILKTMFEGQGGQSNKILTMQDKATGQQGEPHAALNSGYYDRLSQANLRGYSPQLQALQSALNLRRAPGAPKLIETGKLDYETLSYPAYSMRFDIANLEKRLRYERAYAFAALLGAQRQYTREQLFDPAIAQKLAAQAQTAGKKLPQRFARRQAALESAASLLADFSQTALAAKDPARISRALLVALGGKQKEAARWITVASLEEELQHLEIELDFLTPELVQAIHRCPTDEDSRGRFLRRAEGFARDVRALSAADSAAIAALESDGWLPRLAQVQAQLDSAAGLRQGLFMHIADLRAAAFRFAAATDTRPNWRRTLDGLLERLLPGSAYARNLKSAKRSRELLRDVFMKIASGDLGAAHTVLASL